MIEERSVLAVVPARGGSVGIKLKNLRKIQGIPLVGVVGKVLERINFVDRAIVSTDSEEIAEVAESFGLSAPFRRPENLSGNRIGDWDVLVHALRTMENLDQRQYDIVLMLQPTSPFRTPEHVERCTTKLINDRFDAVWSVSETDSKGHPLKQLLVDESGSLDYYDSDGAKIIARQQLKPVFHRNGVAYAISRECLLDQKTIKGTRTGAIVIDEPLANIDTELDLEWAEFLAPKLDLPWLT